MRLEGAFALLAMGACDQTPAGTRPADASMAIVDAPSPLPDAPSTPDAADAALAAASDAMPAAIPDVSAGGGDPGVGLDATDLDASGPAAPAVACDVDAGGDSGLCPPPSSVCADSTWLVFYDNGQCVAGQCTWEKRYIECVVGWCIRDGCQAPVTM